MNILFVCTGNICRSPMAEHLLKKKLKEAGRADVNVASAGVAAETGMDATKEARTALAELGVLEFQHVAQPMSKELATWADLILAMEDRHKFRIVGQYPFAKGKTHVLNAYAGLGNDIDGIDDPYGMPLAVYRDTLTEINLAIEKILGKIN